MEESTKKLLNDRLYDIVAALIIDIHTDVHNLAEQYGLNEEQEIRMVGFVIEKMKRANEDANKKMGIKSLNLD